MSSVEDLKKSRYGWTYVLINPDNRVLKIGRTISSFNERLMYSRTHMPYRELGLHLYFAIDDARLEEVLHTYFSGYHACYLLRDREIAQSMRTYRSLDKYFTEKSALEYSKKRGANDKKLHFTKTKIELFKFPLPIRRAETLEKLIANLISNGYRVKWV